MKLHLSNPGNIRLFTAHGPGYVEVNGERFDRSVVVMTGEIRKDWNVAGFDELNEAHFEYFLALGPEVLLLGTGDRQRFPHPALYRKLAGAGIGVECMDTPAACRTYNILAAEDRKVIAAIMF